MNLNLKLSWVEDEKSSIMNLNLKLSWVEDEKSSITYDSVL